MRVHHPDAHASGQHLPPAERRARFQAITAAYDALRGKRAAGAWGAPGDGDIYRAELERRRRARDAFRRHANTGFTYERAGQSEWTASADDRWKDRVILFVGILVSTPGSGFACGMGEVGLNDRRCRAGVGGGYRPRAPVAVVHGVVSGALDCVAEPRAGKEGCTRVRGGAAERD